VAALGKECLWCDVGELRRNAPLTTDRLEYRTRESAHRGPLLEAAGDQEEFQTAKKLVMMAQKIMLLEQPVPKSELFGDREARTGTPWLFQNLLLFCPVPRLFYGAALYCLTTAIPMPDHPLFPVSLLFCRLVRRSWTQSDICLLAAA